MTDKFMINESVADEFMEDQSRISDVLNRILYPEKEYTPIPFWFFNDEFEEDKVVSQLRDYTEKGVNGIVLHPRIGVPESMPYLSEEYFRAVRFIVKTAAELDMKVVLYDEGMYPSGSAHGMVVQQNPEYASKGIYLAAAAQKISATQGAAAAQKVSGIQESDAAPKVSDIQEPAAVPEVSGIQKPAAAQKISAAWKENAAEGELITVFEDGKRLLYGFTGGTIRGIHFGEDDGEVGAPPSADILNPDAVDLFIRLTHDRYYENLSEYFGNTVIAFFTDEPCALGRNAGRFREWVPGLEKEITAQGGNLEELEGLFTNQKNATTELYHRLIKKKLRETFYAKLAEWCEGHHICLMGHPAESDDIEEELYFQIPGQDLIMRRVSPETGGLLEFDSVQAKLSADIARHLGRRRNANECFGVCSRKDEKGRNIPWYFTGKDMKWFINWMGFRGVNLFVPHAFYYSVAGKRSGERPPDVGPNNIWWNYYRPVSDYMKRLSYLMTDSRNSAKIAVLCDNNRVPYTELAVLYENQIEFNYLPVALLPERKDGNCVQEKAQQSGQLVLEEKNGNYGKGSMQQFGQLISEEKNGNCVQSSMQQSGQQPLAGIKDGKLCIQGYEYEAVLNLLDTSLDGRLEGLKIYHDIDILLQDFLPLREAQPDEACPDLRLVLLEKDGVKMLLASNEGRKRIDTVLMMPKTSQTVEVDLWKGSYVTLPGEGQCPLCLEPCEMKLFLLDEEGEIPAVEREKAQDLGNRTKEFVPDVKRDGKIDIKTDGKPDVKADGRADEKAYVGNQVVYRWDYRAESPSGKEEFTIDGEELAECFCNGHFAGASLYAPHRFRIGPYLVAGENEIKVVFTGNAANLYTGAKIPFGI